MYKWEIDDTGEQRVINFYDKHDQEIMVIVIVYNTPILFDALGITIEAEVWETFTGAIHYVSGENDARRIARALACTYEIIGI
jgi:hypothetical protein